MRKSAWIEPTIGLLKFGQPTNDPTPDPRLLPCAQPNIYILLLALLLVLSAAPLLGLRKLSLLALPFLLKPPLLALPLLLKPPLLALPVFLALPFLALPFLLKVALPFLLTPLLLAQRAPPILRFLCRAAQLLLLLVPPAPIPRCRPFFFLSPRLCFLIFV